MTVSFLDITEPVRSVSSLVVVVFGAAGVVLTALWTVLRPWVERYHNRLAAKHEIGAAFGKAVLAVVHREDADFSRAVVAALRSESGAFRLLHDELYEGELQKLDQTAALTQRNHDMLERLVEEMRAMRMVLEPQRDLLPRQVQVTEHLSQAVDRLAAAVERQEVRAAGIERDVAVLQAQVRPNRRRGE